MSLDLIIAKIKSSWLKKSWEFLRINNEKIQAWILKNQNRKYLFVVIALFINVFTFVNDIFSHTSDIYDYISNHLFLSLLGGLLPSMLICYLVVHFWKEFDALTLNQEKRATALLFSALISIVFVSIFISLMFALLNTPPFATFFQFLLPVDDKGHITGILGHNSVGYALAFLLSLLPSFTLWRFRDQNKRDDQKTASALYENSRKDTNLKDFQQLQKWVVGLETANSGKESDAGESSTSNQTNPLRIAAIHQLGGFFRGEFGEQFQIPAYELLHAIWVNQLVGIEFTGIMDYEAAREHRKLILSKTNNAVAYAIITAIFGDGGVKLVELDGKRLTNSPSLIKKRDWRGINANSVLNLTNAKLRGINFSFADLTLAKLDGANLRGANLRGANLRGANLSRTDLSGANLSRTNLSRADLSGENLSRADLSGADLSGANLSGAYFRGANLSRADLSGAYFRGADLNNTELFEADIDEAQFVNLKSYKDTNLSKCKNAENAYIGYYDRDSTSENIVINHEKTNKLRKEFGLSEMTETEERRLIDLIRFDMQLSRTISSKKA